MQYKEGISYFYDKLIILNGGDQGSMNKGYVLSSSADFDNAMLFGWNVEVWQQDDIIDYGGQIERHTDESVYINSAYYLKVNCTFKVR